MRKTIYILLFTIISISAYTQQVGINTTQPQGVLHIDASGTGLVSKSVVIDTEGNLGVGTIAPTQKLESTRDMLVSKSDTINGNIVVDRDILIGQASSLRIAGGNTTVLSNHLDSITSQLEIISDTKTSAFRFDNGSQKVNNDPTVSMIPVMTKNTANNIVEWSNLPFLTDVRSAKLIDKKNITSGKPIDITEPAGLKLSKGIWLILASTPTDDGGKLANTQGFYVWMRLVNDKDDFTDINTAIAVIGAPTESTVNMTGSGSSLRVTGVSANGYGVSTPQLTYLLYVPDDDQLPYRITLSTSAGTSPAAATSYQTNTNYGNSYFYAIKLDYTN